MTMNLHGLMELGGVIFFVLALDLKCIERYRLTFIAGIWKSDVTFFSLILFWYVESVKESNL
jgi:hypothetical protein